MSRPNFEPNKRFELQQCSRQSIFGDVAFPVGYNSPQFRLLWGHFSKTVICDSGKKINGVLCPIPDDSGEQKHGAPCSSPDNPSRVFFFFVFCLCFRRNFDGFKQKHNSNRKKKKWKVLIDLDSRQPSYGILQGREASCFSDSIHSRRQTKIRNTYAEKISEQLV